MFWAMTVILTARWCRPPCRLPEQTSPGDPLVVAGQGTWSVNPFSGAISFTPLANYDGPVTDITYTVDDDSGATSNPATVSVTISPVNDVPVATFDRRHGC